MRDGGDLDPFDRAAVGVAALAEAVGGAWRLARRTASAVKAIDRAICRASTERGIASPYPTQAAFLVRSEPARRER